MIQTGVFDYINVLDKAADASSLKNKVIANNIANIDTPGYKRQDVNFESVLSAELGKSKYITLDEKIKTVNLSHLDARAYRDATEYSYRLDGNNVDVDTENVQLAANQIKYQGLVDSMGQEFNRLKTAMK